MMPLSGMMRQVSYCRYGTKFRKNTDLWSNNHHLIGPLKVCSAETPCKSKRRDGRHTATAQSGPSANGTAGSGGARYSQCIPSGLLYKLFSPLAANLSLMAYDDSHYHDKSGPPDSNESAETLHLALVGMHQNIDTIAYNDSHYHDKSGPPDSYESAETSHLALVGIHQNIDAIACNDSHYHDKSGPPDSYESAEISHLALVGMHQDINTMACIDDMHNDSLSM